MKKGLRWDFTTEVSVQIRCYVGSWRDQCAVPQRRDGVTEEPHMWFSFY